MNFVNCKIVAPTFLTLECIQQCAVTYLLNFYLFQSCDDIFEPKLDELINQLREIGGLLNHWLTDHLTSKLSSLSSPDDLFNFFSDMRGTLFCHHHPYSSCHLFSISTFMFIFVSLVTRWPFFFFF